MLIDHLYNNTITYSETVNKTKRKDIGQFFTPPHIAKYMASLMEFDQTSIRILDPGAGTAILSGAICKEIIDNKNIKTVHIDLFETDENIIFILQRNMKLIIEELANNGKNFTYTIIQENFILFHELFWKNIEQKRKVELYDVIIANPPYKKIGKLDEEAIAMDSIIYGQPNMYFLFMALSAKLLKQDGQMIFITPRSFTSGLYFRKFREYLLNTVRLTNLHLFHSREDVFDSDKVLQEAIILKAIKKTQEIDTIQISASENMYMDGISVHEVPYDTVIDMNSDNLFIMIPTTEKEIDLLNIMKAWKYNLPSLGFKIKTGPVVDFRATELLREDVGENTVPLLMANHFSDYRITFPAPNSKNPQYIVNTEESKSLLLDSKNYILIKRFTSKEEKRRVQCALYLSEGFTCKKVGIENHLNYVAKLKGEITEEEMFGLFALLNSSFIDLFYRILNGSTQVNATEVNAIPFPSLKEIKWIGKQLMEINGTSTNACDTIIEGVLLNKVYPSIAV